MQQGVKLEGSDVVDEDIEYKIWQLRTKGKSIRAIAKSVGISVGRTHQACSSMSSKKASRLTRNPIRY